MKFLRKIILPVLLAAILLLAVRGLLLCHMRLPDNAALPGLKPGGHVLVSLTYYGLRLPGESLWGCHRWGYAEPEVMYNVVFEPSATAGGPQRALLMAGTCRALRPMPGRSWCRERAAPSSLRRTMPVYLPGCCRLTNIPV